MPHEVNRNLTREATGAEAIRVAIHSYHVAWRAYKLICRFIEMRGSTSRHPLKREVKGRILQITPVVSIVDDDRAVRLALSSLIRSLGWQVRMYESAQEFLSSGEAAHTACLISDVLMPGMSGIEMHERLRAQGHAPATIFITACSTASLQAQVVGAGALVLLPKPCNVATLTHWLSVALGNA